MESLIDRLDGGKTSKILFERGVNYIDGIFSDDASDALLSMDFLGKPLVIYNIEKLLSMYQKIDQILLPANLSSVVDAIARSFPSIQIREYGDDNPNSPSEEDVLRIPLTSVVMKSPEGNCVVNQIVYPWDVLKMMEYVLETEVKFSRISKDASIAETTVIEGPCVIEAGVQIDNFCKIKGPIYIDADTRIGTGSLIRSSMIGKECVVGFSCEIGKSYFAGHDTIPHLDVILDTVIGKNTWMGAYVGTTNAMFNNKNVMYKLGGELIDTGLQHFGAIIGHDCNIGAGAIILPGRYIPAKSFVPPHVLFSSIEKQEPAGKRMG